MTYIAKKDLLISTIFSLLITISLQFSMGCNHSGYMAWGSTSISQVFWSTVWIYYQTVWSIAVVGNLVGGLLGVLILYWIVSFIFNLIIFYSLALFIRKILGKKDVFLFHQLPALFIFVIIVFYILTECRLR